MSKIQQIQSGSLSCSKPTKRKNSASNQTFNGKSEVFDEKELKMIKDIVENKVNKGIGRTGKFFQWLSDTKGEVQNQLSTHIFTTTLAPLMIVCNPFTKNKTKEDKQYLALRQPVSAAIALSGGLAMTITLNNFLDKMYNEGHVKSIDLRFSPNKEYLKKPFKDALKEASKTGKLQEFLEEYDKNINSSIREKGFVNGKLKSTYKRECLKGYMDKVKEQRVNLFTNLISEEPENIKVSNDNIFVNDVDLQKGHLLKVKNLYTQESLNSFLDENNLHKIKFSDFMKKQFKFEFYGEKDGELNGKFKPHSIESNLSNTKALDFLVETGLIEDGKVTESDLRTALVKFQQARNEKVIENEIFSPGILKENGSKKLQEVAGKAASRISEMTVSEEIRKEKSITLSDLFNQLQIDKKSGKLQSLMDMKMSNVLMKFKTELQGKLHGFNDKADLKSFAKNIIKRSADRMSKDAGTHKYYIGIVTNIFTTAVTCTMLNWAYPRFVETFFPKLANSGHKGEVPKQKDAVKIPVKAQNRKEVNNG